MLRSIYYISFLHSFYLPFWYAGNKVQMSNDGTKHKEIHILPFSRKFHLGQANGIWTYLVGLKWYIIRWPFLSTLEYRCGTPDLESFWGDKKKWRWQNDVKLLTMNPFGTVLKAMIQSPLQLKLLSAILT